MHIAIIGNGITGITAARFIRKLSDHQITVISAETDHFFSRTALMYIYMGHMRFVDTKPYEDWFWEKNRIALRRAYVERIEPDAYTLHFAGGETMRYDKLLIASGSRPNKFGWPGQDLERVQGLYSYPDLESMERHSNGLQRAVIVGGGLIGIEMAEMFHSRHIPVTFLVREASFWDMVLPKEESAMVNREIIAHGIDLRLDTELAEIVDDGSGKACAVITKGGERIDCGFVGLTAGVHPNIGFLEGSGIETNKGILVDRHLRTNLPDIYAAGDCAEHRDPREGRRAIEAVWYAGRMSGETVAHVICGNDVSYDPGIWFNSAKFFDIEYQVYGTVPSDAAPSQSQLYWEHKDGRKSVRLVYDRDSGSVMGFNLMGIRYRHEVCDRWLQEGTHIEKVLADLGVANFDPECYREYEQDIVAQYNQQSGAQVRLRSRRGLSAALRFLRSRQSANA
ncbi:MAG: FAD-dependent oxidoreductase [Saprospiraceae bacterium]|nr:FAD-dependent oxidoreductase [Saprospiraceae bacterium]